MSSQERSEAVFSAFWPMSLLALALAIFLGWQLILSARQHIANIRLLDQQALIENQAKVAESRLQALVMDLLDLAKTDEDAQAIAAKYRIKYTPPISQLPAENTAQP